MSKSAVTELEASKELLDAERKEIRRARRPVWAIVAVVVTAVMFVWPLLTLPASEALRAVMPLLYALSPCQHVSCFAPVGWGRPLLMLQQAGLCTLPWSPAADLPTKHMWQASAHSASNWCAVDWLHSLALRPGCDGLQNLPCLQMITTTSTSPSRSYWPS